MAALTSEELKRVCVPPETPGHPTEPRSVLECVHVILDEEWEHSCYASLTRVVGMYATEHCTMPPCGSTGRQEEDPTAALIKTRLCEPIYRHRCWYIDFRYLVRIGTGSTRS